MPRKHRLSAKQETDQWFKRKEAEWRAAGRLRPDGSLIVNTSWPHARPDLSVEEVRSMLMVLPRVDARSQKREARRLRGRKMKTWRRRFDKSGPDE